jgi:hypothetical protein
MTVLRNEQDRGFAASQNRAIASARGEFVACQDQDDVSLPVRLARQVEVLERDPSVGLVGVWPQYTDDFGAFIEPGRFAYEVANERLRDFLMEGYCLCGPTIVVRRGLLGRDPYDSTFKAAEDFDLLLRLTEITRPANVPERLYLYRQHAHSVSHVRRQIQMHSVAAAREAALRRRFRAEAPRDLVSHIARGYLRAGYVALGMRQMETGRESIAGAQRLAPEPALFARLAGDELMRYLVNFPHDDPQRVVEAAFVGLLPRTRALQRQRSRILGRVHIAQVFDGFPSRTPGALLPRLWAGVRSDPRWLLNRGVWAIGVREAVAAGRRLLA